MRNFPAIIHKSFVITALLLTSPMTIAQEIHDVQSWWNITAIGSLAYKTKSPVKYWLEGQERVGDDMTRVSQELFRPGLGYALNESLSIWVGYAWIRTAIPFTIESFSEQRLWEQLIWQERFPHLTLISRTRLEQRYFENNPTTGWRFRELFKMISPLTSSPRWSIVGYDEIFINLNTLTGLNNIGYDQNRFFMGIGYQINSFATAEIGYLNQYIYRRNTIDFWSNNVSANIFLNF